MKLKKVRNDEKCEDSDNCEFVDLYPVPKIKKWIASKTEVENFSKLYTENKTLKLCGYFIFNEYMRLHNSYCMLFFKSSHNKK